MRARMARYGRALRYVGLGAVVLGFGAAVAMMDTGGAAAPGSTAAETPAIQTSRDPCADQWPPAEDCLRSVMARSGREAPVRVVRESTAAADRSSAESEASEPPGSLPDLGPIRRDPEPEERAAAKSASPAGAPRRKARPAPRPVQEVRAPVIVGPREPFLDRN